MKRLLCMVALLSLILPIQAWAGYPIELMPRGAYTSDPAHTSVIWRVSHMGLSFYTARLAKVDATLDFHPRDISSSQLNVDIDMNSVRTEYPFPEMEDFDKTLAKSDKWFNADVYPRAVYVSRILKRLSPTRGVIEGDLTFLGVTKPLALDVTFNGAIMDHPFSHRPAMGFSAIGKMKRSDWGLATFVPMVGDEVELLIEVEFIKSNS